MQISPVASPIATTAIVAAAGLTDSFPLGPGDSPDSNPMATRDHGDRTYTLFGLSCDDEWYVCRVTPDHDAILVLDPAENLPAQFAAAVALIDSGADLAAAGWDIH